MRYYFLKFFFLLSSTFAILFFASCVSSKKYEDLESKNSYLVAENLNLKNAKKEAAANEKKIAEIEKQLQATEDLLKDMNAKYNGINENYQQLLLDYDDLNLKNREILNSTSGEKSNLENELAVKQNELDQKAKVLLEKEAILEKKTNELNELTQTIQVREMQIAELNTSLNAQKNMLLEMKNRISAALSGFNSTDLQVIQKPNGKVYISLSQDLLFSKGSDKIDDKGRSAIIKLAEVLITNDDIDVLVEGHTDSDGTSQRNWDLSVTRATEVVKILQSSGVKPERLTASGRAFYLPVLPNDSETNKAKNRRTEIILSPKLDKLYDLIQGQ